jgi:hypothetical protein
MQATKFLVFDEAGEVPAGTGGAPMPIGSAYMPPGHYLLQGQSWDCTRPGLYRFKLSDNPGGASHPYVLNRIVCTWSGQADVYALLSAVCHHHIHASQDEGLDWQIMSNRGIYGKWRARCWVIVGLMVWTLPQFGVQARAVNIATTLPRNHYDDGHFVLETLHGTEWRMWDLTMGCYWRNAAGRHLSTSEFIAHIASGGPLPERCDLDPGDRRFQTDVVPVGSHRLDMGLYNEMCSGSPEQQEAWLRRIFQTIVLPNPY